MIDEARWVVFDCEGDGLKPTKFHCLSYHDFKGLKETHTSYPKIIDFFSENDVYVGHNIKRWDLPQLQRVLDFEISKDILIVDTLAVAWYLEPLRGRHNLESYGEEFGVPKPKIDDWLNLNLSDYINRCETDVQINTLLWKKQLDYLNKLYPDPDDLFRFLRYLDFKMHCAELAESSGWKLDEKKCKENLDILLKERDEKVNELKQRMPRVPIISYRSPPKRSIKADGELSLLGIRWQKLLEKEGLPPDYSGVVEEITGDEQGNPASHHQLKSWLYSLGWVPQTIKYQRDKKSNEIKEIPQIYTEHTKEVCPSIERLFEKEPALELLDGLGVLNHRVSILSGFLRDVDPDGYLHACIAGLTNTLRFKHAVLVNLPKPEKKYGEFIRSVLIAPDEHELCGADMSGLEDRLKQNFIYPYDPEYVNRLNEEGYDPHTTVAVLAGMMTEDQKEQYRRISVLLEKEETKVLLQEKEITLFKQLKPIRSIAKNGNYACQYNAQIARLMITCGIDREAATRLFEAYWELNWAIKEVIKRQLIKEIGEQLWLYNPISHFWYSLRTKRDIFSTLIQGSASYVFDVWIGHVLHERPQITAQFHDEGVWTLRKGHREEMSLILRNAIDETNEFLKLNRELDIDIKFADRYSDIH